ncbi:hypothetical protein Scep_027262 [Stephania cephalantha]|uniref:Uncharacterized protein n=1 Tax=Stephania cephalantha TaxID=152367 RepID=A0AAP0E7K2_9MAGN
MGSAGVMLCEVLKGGGAAEPVDNPIQCMAVNVWRDQSGGGKGVEEQEDFGLLEFLNSITRIDWKRFSNL